MSPPPQKIKIYHIVHIDKLAAIVQDGGLFSDAILKNKQPIGSMIGLERLKQRRLYKLKLHSHPDLYVGECVPFYFSPRSVMLFLIHCRNQELAYQGGQAPIIHLQADFYRVVDWADQQNPWVRWVFTTSNASSNYFEDFNQVDDLKRIDWRAVQANIWKECQDVKQAEFLLENHCPWHLIEHIGVHSKFYHQQVKDIIKQTRHQPTIEITPHWYY